MKETASKSDSDTNFNSIHDERTTILALGDFAFHLIVATISSAIGPKFWICFRLPRPQYHHVIGKLLAAVALETCLVTYAWFQ